MSKSGAARLLRVSLSSVKRYAKIANRGGSLRPRKGGGRPPTTDETTKKLLQEGVKERPAATVSEGRRFLERTRGRALSDSTVQRLLKRMGFSQKDGLCGGDGARRVAENRLEGYARRTDRSKAAGVRGRDGYQHLPFSSAGLVAASRAASQMVGAAQPWSEHDAAFEHDGRGWGHSMAVEGATTKAVLEAYVEEVLAPTLRPGRVVILDNLTAHKGERVKGLIEERGCELVYLPPYSPGLDPIEEAFAKIKDRLRKAEARTREALVLW